MEFRREGSTDGGRGHIKGKDSMMNKWEMKVNAPVPRYTDGRQIVSMRVRVLFFGTLKGLVGRSEDWLTVPDGARVRAVVEHYQRTVPGLAGLMASTAVSVNEEYSNPEAALKEGDEVGLLPPVSGGTADSYCAIVREPIRTQKILEQIKRPEDGAAVVFEGVVRNNTRGRRTLYLDYEAYEGMALKQMRALAGQALADFKVRDVAIVHRLGRLEIGETSVLIAVASAHRGAAFDACRWVIDTLKRTVPIWKKEYFEDGAVWADGEPFPASVLTPGSGQKS
jgi:molybdopterin synthase catalytic subunit